MMNHEEVSNALARVAADAEQEHDDSGFRKSMSDALKVLRPVMREMSPENRRKVCEALTRCWEERRGGDEISKQSGRFYNSLRTALPAPASRFGNLPYSNRFGRYGAAFPVAYICSRYAGKDREEVEENLRWTERFCAFALKGNAAPVAPHLMYSRILEDDNPEERDLGMRCGIRLLRQCDEVWVLVRDGISAGMAEEINMASRLGKAVRFFSPANLEEEEPDESDL